MIVNISIQGQANSFHDIAANKFFNNPTIISCETFRETINQLCSKKSEYAVVAIENSLYGTINEVYDLILNNDVFIIGEIYLRIEQNLIGIKNVKLDEIKEVHSHPVALAQCEDFLDKVLPKVLRFEHHDTAGSVLDIKKWDDKTKAAIASFEAAEQSDMTVLARSIETNKQNYTRFVVLSRKQNLQVKTNKTSLVVQTLKDNSSGSLLSILSQFANNNINMTALHSRPIIGKAWHYMFYMDIEIDSTSKEYTEIINNLENMGCNLTILGNYNSGLK